MLKAFSICFLSLCGFGSASACVDIQRSGLQHLIVNNCLYPVIVYYVASNGQSGATGSIAPGGLDLTPIFLRYSLQVRWCNYNDWNAGRCKLPQN